MEARIWCLLGGKAGDNTQVKALADALAADAGGAAAGGAGGGEAGVAGADKDGTVGAGKAGVAGGDETGIGDAGKAGVAGAGKAGINGADETGGDGAAVRSAAYIEKRIVARPWELLTHFLPFITLAGIDRRRSSPLVPPWPDLVITAGRRNEAVARWIRRQSGGAARLAHIGRPWAAPDCFDLIVATPQYFLPRRGNIIHNSMPLSRFTPEALRAAGERLRPRLAPLPRPWVALLAGGNSGKFVFTPEKGRRLGRAAREMAAAQGGAVLMTDSPRTPWAAGDAIEAELRPQDFRYRWAGGDGGAPIEPAARSRNPRSNPPLGQSVNSLAELPFNPYSGILALADAFVVTGESMSMLGEALHTGKPLYIFDLSDRRPWYLLPHNYRYKPLSHRLAMALAPPRMRRDVGVIQQRLVASGRAQWLDEPGTRPAAVPNAPIAQKSAEARMDGKGTAKAQSGAADAKRLAESPTRVDWNNAAPPASPVDELARTAATVRRLLPSR